MTGQNVVPFEFEGNCVRAIERDGEPWFVLADVCRILDYSDSAQAARNLDAEDVDTLYNMQGMTQSRNGIVKIINESGLYSLILTSRKPEAKRFKKWVTAEVLPEIRKTGTFGIDPFAVLEDPAKMRHLLLTYTEKVLALEADLAEAAPKVAAYERLASSEGSMCLTDAAKHLQMRPKDLIQWMKTRRWIYRRAGTGHWIGYQDKIQSGLLDHKVTEVTRSDGSNKITEQVRVTASGLARLAKAMAAPARLPLETGRAA